MKHHDLHSTSKNSNSAVTAQERRKTVMIVEDDATHRRFMEEILRGCGLATVPAESGTVALDVLGTGIPIDLIIMDWDIPDMNGLETTKHIRAQQFKDNSAHIPILAFTGHRLPGDREKCLAAGMDAYLPKGVCLPKWRQTLVDNLHSLIEGNFNLEEFQDENADTTQHTVYANFNVNEFNSTILRETRALLKDGFAETVEEYLEDAALYIGRINDGIAEGNKEKVAKNSHPLKSNSKGFGLMALAGVAEAINLAALRAIETGAPLKAAEDLFPQLVETFIRAKEKLLSQI